MLTLTVIDVPIARPETSNGPRVVQGFTHPDAPGLAITPDFSGRRPLGTYSITHVRSGHSAAARGLSFWKATALLPTVAAMTDWTQDMATVCAVDGLAARIRAAVLALDAESEGR